MDIGHAICFIFLTSTYFAASASFQQRLDLNIFNTDYISAIEQSLKNESAGFTPGIWRTTLSRIGKIAFYLRIYRAYIHSSQTGRKGFERYFPEPPVNFHPWVYGNCTVQKEEEMRTKCSERKSNSSTFSILPLNTTLMNNSSFDRCFNDEGTTEQNNKHIPLFQKCIDSIFENIQNRTMVLFPFKTHMVDNFELNEELFNRAIHNTMFSYDVSVSYLFCFLTKNKLSILKSLPFCSYGLESHQKKIWPSGQLRECKDQPLLVCDENTHFDPIDDLSRNAFECADESFCPDPCCARRSGRFLNRKPSKLLRFKSLHKQLQQPNVAGYCAHSVCVDNVRQTDSELAQDHFRKANETQQQSPSMMMEIATHSCIVYGTFNDDLMGMLENRWNLSCACLNENGLTDDSRMYRGDVRQCVDIDECIFNECKKKNEVCVNTIGNYTCACKIDYRRDTSTNECVQLPSISSLHIYPRGSALSQTSNYHPKMVSAFVILALFSILI